MVINYLNVVNGFEKKTFYFKEGFNQIYSEQNSKGKSTLFRLVLHALGYSIPATSGFKNFDKIVTTISILNNNKEYIIERADTHISLKVDNDILNYILPIQIDELHSMLYGIDDVLILDNLLATFYIDQDKGWTLLNRGKIIGNNRFNIEDFITGLSEKDVSNITLKIEQVNSELKKYRFLLETAKYKNDLEHNDSSISTPAEENKELLKSKTSLSFQKNEIEKEIKELDKIVNKNGDLMLWIEKMKLSVKDDNGKTIMITRNNVENYGDNQTYLEARKKTISLELTKIKNQIQRIEKELSDRNVLVDVKSLVEEMDDTIRGMNINYHKINNIVEDLSKNKTELKRRLDDIFASNNKFLEEIFEDVKKYATSFGIAERVPNDIRFVMTKKLKGFSGRVLNQLTFSFKLAYINQIKRKYNIKLPIIIDSLKNGELTDLAATNMLDVLRDDFGEHQIIIASVYKYDICKNCITIKEYLMEE